MTTNDNLASSSKTTLNELNRIGRNVFHKSFDCSTKMTDAIIQSADEQHVKALLGSPFPDEDDDDDESETSVKTRKLDLTGSTLDALKRSPWNRAIISRLARKAYVLSDKIPNLSHRSTLEWWITWYKRRVHDVLRNAHNSKGKEKEKEGEDDDQERQGVGGGVSEEKEELDEDEAQGEPEESEDEDGNVFAEGDVIENRRASGGSRFVKWDRRMHTSIVMTKKSRERGDEEALAAWHYIGRATHEMGPAGMSDEEDGEEGGEIVKLVHGVEFRHPLYRDVFEMSDQTRYLEPEVFKKKGRRRPRGVLSSRVTDHNPPDGLAPERYDP
ncbi:hypothetical protein V5O48_012688 [Marasmius crinis-equi]|uniref:Uncharacterized protein n=1 Tax=Marasmius crinis-equi TaxID=585013 RepID=A0ABR3F251_9AGAR